MSEIIINENINNVIVSINELNEDVNVLINETFETFVIQIEEKGQKGDSTYEIALLNGFVGTELQWLESLKDLDGGIIY
jgi:hypothetical protein